MYTIQIINKADQLWDEGLVIEKLIRKGLKVRLVTTTTPTTTTTTKKKNKKACFHQMMPSLNEIFQEFL